MFIEKRKLSVVLVLFVFLSTFIVFTVSSMFADDAVDTVSQPGNSPLPVPPEEDALPPDIPWNELPWCNDGKEIIRYPENARTPTKEDMLAPSACKVPPLVLPEGGKDNPDGADLRIPRRGKNVEDKVKSSAIDATNYAYGGAINLSANQNINRAIALYA